MQKPNHPATPRKASGRWSVVFALLPALLLLVPLTGLAVSPPPPCHPNPNAGADVTTILGRGDVVSLPDPLKFHMAELARRPHTYLPLQVYAEANSPSQLFQYYILTTKNFEPNPFTAIFPGLNDQAQLTATGPNCGMPTIGTVRVVLEPKPGLPTDPSDIRAFNDVFTDISGLFVINDESGWYEGWMIHDLTVPKVAPPRLSGMAQFGTITSADASALVAMGIGQNVPGHLFTMDGNPPHQPSPFDFFPFDQTNLVPLQVSMGAYNSLQQSDAHAYWEFNYTTNWVHPLYELPFTGGLDLTFWDGLVGAYCSVVPGPGPGGPPNDPVLYGDNPNTAGVLQGTGPRDPDKFDAADDFQREFRYRGVPSGLGNEILLDVYQRIVSFEPWNFDIFGRIFDAYVYEVGLVDQDADGVISALEGDPDSASDGFLDNTRLYMPPTVFNRFAVTREINDGMLAPRFAPSQRAWVLSGKIVRVMPTVPASAGRDGDDR